MKPFHFNLLVVLSLTLAAVLCLGFIGEAGVAIARNPAGGNTARGVHLSLGEGRVVCYLQRLQPVTPMVPVGWSISWQRRFRPLRAPSLSRSIWEFDAHPLNIASVPGLQMFLLACPIWCVEVPLLIAPAIWLIRWRRKRLQERGAVQGFTVEPVDSPPAIEPGP